MSILLACAKPVARLIAIAALAGLAGCGTFYVDNGLHDLTPAERATVANPKPAQLLYDFQTKGATNTRARDYTAANVTQAVQDSGLFSVVSPEPQPNGAVLQVTVDNVPLEDDAFAKGFATGLTLGVVGNTVGDGYICTVEYVGGASGDKISKSVRDAIYTSIGATAPTPDHAIKAKSIDDAVHAMIHKCVGNALDQLARDPGFAK